MCRSLGVGADEDYLLDCARIVRKEPHRSRHDVAWSRTLVAEVERNLARFPFLRSYAFDE